MAAPHISGLAALTLSHNPDLTTVELRQLLSSNTVGTARNSDALGKANTTKTVAYAAFGVVWMTTNHGLQWITSEGPEEFNSASMTQKSSSKLVNVTAPTGPRNSAVDRYFDAFEHDSESQFDASGLLELQDFA